MIDTVAGAKSSAIIYSIAETAKANEYYGAAEPPVRCAEENEKERKAWRAFVEDMVAQELDRFRSNVLFI